MSDNPLSRKKRNDAKAVKGFKRANLSRRDMIGSIIRTASYGLVGPLLEPLLPLRAKSLLSEQAPTAYNWEDHNYAFLINTYKCIGCGMCVKACKLENNVPDGFYRTWVERYIIPEMVQEALTEIDSPNGGLYGFKPEEIQFTVQKAFFVPKQCNHCRNTPCTQVCPVGASYATKDGIVLVDEKHCIGCGYCVQACPYGSRFIHPITRTASKCTACYHRLTKGHKPACVENCPVGAKLLGDLKRRDDVVRKILATKRVAVLQENLLTVPYCFYLGLDKEVR